LLEVDNGSKIYPIDDKLYNVRALSRFYRRTEFSGGVSSELHRAISAFIGDTKVLPRIQKGASIG